MTITTRINRQFYMKMVFYIIFIAGHVRSRRSMPTRLFGEYRTICVAASKPFLKKRIEINWETDQMEKDRI